MKNQKGKAGILIFVIALLVGSFVFYRPNNYDLRMIHNEGKIVAKIGEEEFTTGDIEEFKRYRQEAMEREIEQDPTMKEYYTEKGLIDVSDDEILETIIESELLIRESERTGIVKDAIKTAKDQVELQKLIASGDEIDFKEGKEISSEELEKMRYELNLEVNKVIKEKGWTEEQYWDKYLVESIARSIAGRMMSDKIIEDIAKDLNDVSEEEVGTIIQQKYSEKINELKEQYKVQKFEENI